MNSIITKTFLHNFTSLFSNSMKYSFALLDAKPSKKPQIAFQKWNILRGDVVKIIAGKDKNKIGKVTRVWRKSNQITVRGVNIKIKKISNFYLYFKKAPKLVSVFLKERLSLSICQMQDFMTVKLKKQ
jgi:hypothetical protein